MTVQHYIADGTGTGLKAKVNDSNAVKIYQSLPNVPEIGTPNVYRYLQVKLGSTGGGSGSLSMNVDGSVTPQEFYIEASSDYDTYIMGISILIADASIVHNAFGNQGVLTTGWDLKLKEAGEFTYIVEKAKTGGELIAQSGFAYPYGNTGTTWELTNWLANGDAQTVHLPISNYIPTGIRLGRGTTDRLSSIINDDISGLTDFFVICHGYKHYPITTQGA